MIGSLVLISAVLGSKPDTLLVLNKRDNTLWLRDLSTLKVEAKLTMGPNPNEVAVSPDGSLAIVSNIGANPAGKTLSLIDLKSKTVKKELSIDPHGAPHGVFWLTNERIAFTSHVSDAVCEFDLKSERITSVIPTQQKGTHLAVFTKNQDRCYAVNAFSGSVSAIDYKKKVLIANIPTGKRAEGISISPDGNWVACGNVEGGNVSLINTKTNKVEKTLENLQVPIRTLFVNKGKNLIVSAVGTGTLEVFETKNWQRVKSIELKQKPIADAMYGNQWPVPMNLFETGSDRAYVVLVTSHAVAEINTKTWVVVQTFDTGEIPDGMAVKVG